jgi:hypothetical protein
MLAFFDSLVQRDLRYYPYMRFHILGPFLPCPHPILAKIYNWYTRHYKPPLVHFLPPFLKTISLL